MKKFIQMTVVLVALFTISCSTQTAVIDGGSGGGGVNKSEPVCIRRPAREVFVGGGITDNVVTSTWGETTNTPYWWNDLRNGQAERQNTNPSEVVLVDRSTGRTWRQGCGNEVTSAPAPARMAQANGGNSIVQNGPSYAFEFNLPITIINSDAGCPPQRQYQQRQYQPRQYQQRTYFQQRNYCAPRPIVRCAPRPIIRCAPQPMVRYCQPPPRRYCR